MSNTPSRTVTTDYGTTYKVQWRKVSQDRYDDMLECLPPIWRKGFGHRAFMVGEAWSSQPCSVTGRLFCPSFQAFVCIEGQCYECEAPLTVAEFQALKPDDVLGAVAEKVEA